MQLYSEAVNATTVRPVNLIYCLLSLPQSLQTLTAQFLLWLLILTDFQAKNIIRRMTFENALTIHCELTLPGAYVALPITTVSYFQATDSYYQL